jgi:small-conductance mechanosensitive channel
MQKAIDFLEPFFEPGLSLILIILFLILNSWVFRKMKPVKESTHIVRRTISFVIILIGALVFILSLPIEQSEKGQILSFLGIIISAGIALSSTTVLGNLIAGIMNNSMNRFRNGDLIKVSDFQGRVTRKSAFHTEIQLEDSNFMTIPNLFMATHPVKLTRKTNTVISTTVSLGYDVPRNKIEEALKEAATAAGLNDPYVYITELGDYSVVYKIHGFLDDSRKFFSANSLLNAKVMDVLHQKEIEIVSPSFMNQRRVDEQKFVPPVIVQEPEGTREETPEELIFTEANEAEKIENKKDYLSRIEKKKQELKERLKELKEEEEIERVKSVLQRLDETREKIQEEIDEKDDKDK